MAWPHCRACGLSITYIFPLAGFISDSGFLLTLLYAYAVVC